MYASVLPMEAPTNIWQIKLPSGYYFGITAASAETPDSFEVDKFTVSTTSSFTSEEISRTPKAVQRENEQQLQELREQSNTGSQRGAKEQNAAAASNSINMQFDEYNSRLQAVTHQVDNVFSELQSLGKKLEERHVEMAGKAMPTIPYEQIDRRLQAIEQTVQRIQQEVESRDYKEHLTSLQATLKDTQSSLTDSLPETLSKSWSPFVAHPVDLGLTLASSRYNVDPKDGSAHFHLHRLSATPGSALRSVQASESKSGEEIPLERRGHIRLSHCSIVHVDLFAGALCAYQRS